MEAHGTGTALGDPIEVIIKIQMAHVITLGFKVGAAVGALSVNSKFVQCACLKSNMGHLEASAAAAGLASLIFVPLREFTIAVNVQLNRLVILE